MMSLLPPARMTTVARSTQLNGRSRVFDDHVGPTATLNSWQP